MRWVTVLIAISAFAPQPAVSNVVRHPAIPESILGTWAMSPESCKNADKSVIVLSAKTYVGSKMNCGVRSVSETPGPDGPIYSARMQCPKQAAPVQKGTTDLVFMPTDADHLSAGSDFDNLTTYQRCPSSKK